jgi:hypothetical protein
VSCAKLDNPDDYRFLILDGHGSHLTIKFFDLCFEHKIILAVFLSHATHRLQPLDIGMFRPFAMAYSRCLQKWVTDRMGLCRFTKREFYEVFWSAYLQSFTESNILSAWSKSGLWPQDASKIINVIKPPPSRPNSAHSGSSIVSIHAFGKSNESSKLLCMV